MTVSGTQLGLYSEIYKKYSMKIASFFLLTLLFLTNFTLAQNKVEQAITSFVAKSGMEHASISVEVFDLGSDKIVGNHNENNSLPTASTAKLFSTATALEILGADYQATTRVYIDGTVDEEGILQGNVWIRGGGDPSLGSKYFNTKGHELDFMLEWIEALKSKGIKKISGRVIGDGSAFGYEGAPDGWNWSDMGNYYGAGPSGLTIYDNLVRYKFDVPSKAGLSTTVKSISPYVPGLIYHNYVKSSTRKGDHAYLYGAPYSLDRFGSGTLPVGRKDFLVKGSLPDPEQQFAYEFSRLLRENDISVMEESSTVRKMEITPNYTNMTLILSYKGEKLSAIVKEINHRSVNLFAEHMISLIGYEKTGDGSLSSGLKVLENHWKSKIDISGLYITDGSGLSRSNAISANHFVQLLKAMNTSKVSEVYISSLPVAGVSGTLRNVCKGQAGDNRISAKSGSMTRIKSYAGYIDTTTGKRLAFAVIVNNYSCSYGALKSYIQSLLNQFSTY